MKTTEINNQNEFTAIKPLSDYTMDELKKLYKSFSLYVTTEYFKYRKIYKDDEHLSIINVTGEGYSTEFHQRLFNSFRISTLDSRIERGDYKNEEEMFKYRNEIAALRNVNETLYWFIGCGEKIIENYGTDELDDYENELYEELHLNDDYDIENECATKYEIYTFIWETLRFCSIKELSNLCKFADKKFEFNQAHRPRKNAKIFKYDKDDNLIATYNNRAECIEKDNIKKSMLSLVLSGKRKEYKGYKYVEEDK